MFDVNKAARSTIRAVHEYVPNKPPDSIMKEMGIEHFVDLATNENPYGISPLAYKAILRESKSSLNHYPESTCFELRKKLSEIHCLSPDCFIVDNGLDSIIRLIGLTFLDAGDEIIIGSSTFSAYETTAKIMGAKVNKIPLTEDYRLNIDLMISACNRNTKAIFICNPNNPTGTIITKSEFIKLMEKISPSILVISDEAFYEFSDSPDFPQTIPFLSEYPNLIILRSFSKTMGLAGLRIGYAISSEEIIRMMMRIREPFPVNRLAQVAAMATLDDKDFIQQTLEINRDSRVKMAKAMQLLRLKCIPGQTNFIFVDLGQPVEPIWNALFSKGIIVRRLDGMNLPTGIRICLGKQKDLQFALNGLAEILGAPAPLIFDL